MKGISNPGKSAEEKAAPRGVEEEAVPAPVDKLRRMTMKGIPGGTEPMSAAPAVPHPTAPVPDPARATPTSVDCIAPAEQMRKLAQAIQIELLDNLFKRIRQKHEAALEAQRRAKEAAARRERFATWLHSSSRYAKEVAKAPSVERFVSIAALTEEAERRLAADTAAEEQVFSQPIAMLEPVLSKIADLEMQRAQLGEPERHQYYPLAAVLALIPSGGVWIFKGATPSFVALGVLWSVIAALFAGSELRHRRALRLIREERQRIDDEISYLRGGLKSCLNAWVLESRELGRKQRDLAKAALDRLKAEIATTLSTETTRIQQQADAFLKTTGYIGAGWGDALWSRWTPASAPAPALRFGSLSFHASLGDGLDEATRLPHLPHLPALVSMHNGQGVLLSARGDSKAAAIATVQGLITRLLATTPPGRLYFTFVDPVALGGNVGVFMGLKDKLDRLVNTRAWSEPSDIENRLGELVEQIEDIIQRRIPNPKETIEDYNARAGVLAEPYRVLVVLDFPNNFNDTALRRLVSLAQNGPRCGLYPIIVRDLSLELPYRFDIGDLERVTVCIDEKADGFSWRDPLMQRAKLTLDKPAPGALTERVVSSFGTLAKEAEKIEIRYPALLDRVGLKAGTWGTYSTLNCLEIPLGITGRGEVVYLRFGEAGTTLHHGLMAGRPGSGKSNLMHIIVATGALAYPPSELEFYLIDLKNGVEFTPYAKNDLPHARVIAVDDDPEYGLSVLEGLMDELSDRGRRFAEAEKKDLTSYRKHTGVPMPRILLLVDEFQKLFPKENAVLANRSASVIDELVRLGRFAGIHVLLSSQNIGRGNTIASATADMMPVRMAMECSEQTSRQLFDDGNLAAARLSRAGQAIYNNGGGIKDANTDFQVALMTDDDLKDQLKAIEIYLDSSDPARKVRRKPQVFLGNEPARLENCQPLLDALSDHFEKVNRLDINAWLGEPIAIKPIVAAQFGRNSRKHLLVVSLNEAQGIAMMLSAIVGIASQQPSDEAEFHILDLSSDDDAWKGLVPTLRDQLPHTVEVATSREIPDQLKMLHALLQERLVVGRPVSPTVYCVVLGLHRARTLREGDDYFSREDTNDPRNQWLQLLRDGPEQGVHVLAWCDSVPNLQRMGRAGMGEFRMCVAGPMSDSDSSQLIDNTAAGKLKPNRAIYVDLDRPESLTQFRPYALPDSRWLDSALERIKVREAP